MDDLLNAIQAEKLHLALAKILPLKQAADAHRLIESRVTIGRVPLSID